MLRYLKAKQQSSGAGFEELKTRQLSKAEKPDGKAISGKKTDDTSFIHMTHLGVKEKRNRQKKLKEKRAWHGGAARRLSRDHKPSPPADPALPCPPCRLQVRTCSLV